MFEETLGCLGSIGSVVSLLGAVTYLGMGRQDPRLLNPRWGFFSHPNFIAGAVLILFCWLVKLVVHLVDPSIPLFGPALLWYRISREKGYYDDSFYSGDW